MEKKQVLEPKLRLKAKKIKNMKKTLGLTWKDLTGGKISRQTAYEAVKRGSPIYVWEISQALGIEPRQLVKIVWVPRK